MKTPTQNATEIADPIRKPSRNIIGSYSYGHKNPSPFLGERSSEHTSVMPTLLHRHFSSFYPFQDDITDYTASIEKINIFF